MSSDPRLSGQPWTGEWWWPGSLPAFRALGWKTLAEAREAGPGILARRTGNYEFRRWAGAWEGREVWLKKSCPANSGWRSGAGRSGVRARREFEAITAWSRAGFRVPQLLAYGEIRRWGRTIFSLLLAEPPEGEFLETWLQGSDAESPVRRRGVFRAIGSEVGRLHREGFLHGSLEPASLLVGGDPKEGGIRIGFFHLEVSRAGRPGPGREALREVARFYARCRVLATLAEWGRFLAAYAEARGMAVRDLPQRWMRETIRAYGNDWARECAREGRVVPGGAGSYARLRQWRLETLEQGLSCPGEVVNFHRYRQVLRIDLPRGGGRAFLKRYDPFFRLVPGAERGMAARVSQCLEEVEKLSWFRERGFTVPAVLAYAAREGVTAGGARPGLPPAAWILLREAPGTSLYELLSRPRQPRPWAASLALELARMHRAGLAFGNLYAGHLFLSATRGGAWTWTFIDVATACRSASDAGLEERARDLACLWLTCRDLLGGTGAAHRFLARYRRAAGWERRRARVLGRAVLRVSVRLARKSAVQEYVRHHAAPSHRFWYYPEARLLVNRQDVTEWEKAGWQEPGRIFSDDVGEVLRHLSDRSNLRGCLGRDGFYLKRCRGRGAWDEWRALLDLAGRGFRVPRPMALAARGEDTLIMVQAVPGGVPLDDVLREEGARWPDERRRRLIRELAGYGARFHGAGFRHRDFYLCHFLVDRDALTPLTLIDLQRAFRPRRWRRWWRLKDLGALHYSFRAVPWLGTPEREHFWRYYWGEPGLPFLPDRLWRRLVAWKENGIARHDARARLRREREKRERENLPTDPPGGK